MNCKFLFFVGICGVLLAACSAEERDTAGTGQVSPALTADYSVPLSTDPTVLTTTSFQPSTKDFAISIFNEDGTLFRSWNSFSEFPENMKFPLGSYVFKASYGNESSEGFDMPYFEGSEPFRVFDQQNTDISVTCTLANAKVSLIYTEAFKNYFSDFATTLKTESNNSIIFSKEEEREAYVKPGKIIMQMSLVKPDGSSMSFSPEIFIAEACTHYKINFDVNNGDVGNAELNITFDETTELNPISINLADGSLSMLPPFTTSMGFESGVAMTVKEFDTSLGDINTLITAPSGFASCTLTTSSAYLQSKGWPAEVDLSALTPEQEALFASMGLRLRGFVNKDKMAYVDFSDLVPKLEYVEGSADHTFTLKATDTQGKAADEVTLVITSQPRVFVLQTPASVLIGSTQAVIPVQLDGDPSLVAIRYKDDNGQEHACPVIQVESASEQIYNLTVQLPVGNRSKEISATYNGLKTLPSVTLATVTPPYTISLENEGDVWAKKATITVTAADAANQAVVMEYLALYNDNTKVNFTQQGDNKIFISGLASSTKYRFKATCTDYAGNTEFSDELSFTTESELAVPNGDFEDLVQTYNVPEMNMNGEWSPTIGRPYYQNTVSFTISEPVSWTSVNAKTCNLNASNQNSWFVIPSTYNTTLSWSGKCPGLRIFGSGKGEETPATYQNLTAQSGTNAMVVRNVAWDENGTTPAAHALTRSDVNNYYSYNVATIANRSAGKLFLGSYSYSNGVETYTEGILFESRPETLNGYYKYENDSQDSTESGVVTITLLAGNTVIATGSANLSAVNNYTAFSVSLNYTDKSKKATSLKIMITSSNHASYTQSEETSSILTTVYNSKYESSSYGAMLTIDNLTFSYE